MEKLDNLYYFKWRFFPFNKYQKCKAPKSNFQTFQAFFLVLLNDTSWENSKQRGGFFKILFENRENFYSFFPKVHLFCVQRVFPIAYWQVQRIGSWPYDKWMNWWWRQPKRSFRAQETEVFTIIELFRFPSTYEYLWATRFFSETVLPKSKERV